MVWVLGKSISNSNSYKKLWDQVMASRKLVSMLISYQDQTLCVECLIEESQSVNMPIIEESDKKLPETM